MTIYVLHIFDKNGTSLYNKEWCRRKKSSMKKDEELKLMYGMLYSIKSFVSKMSLRDSNEGFLSYTTSAYKLHFYESPTGIKYVLMTDTDVGSMRETLKKIHNSYYVEYIVWNPIAKLNEPFESNLFESKLNSFITGLPIYTDSVE